MFKSSYGKDIIEIKLYVYSNCLIIVQSRFDQIACLEKF